MKHNFKPDFSFCGALVTLSLLGALGHTAQAQVQLSWKDNSHFESQFTVERATNAAGPFTYCGQTAANVTSFVDNYVSAGATYYYRVKAQTPTWTSNYTNVASKTIAAVVTGSGTGLKGQYYQDSALSTIIRTETDPQVNFNWGTDSPGPSLPATNFSVRWSGSILTQEGGTYSFQTETGGGVHLWINNVLIINQWTTPGTYVVPVTLAGNTRYAVKMEFVEKPGSAFSRLKWTKPGGAVVLVPKSQLFPS